MSADGELTGEIGERLVSVFKDHDVYHDHGTNGCTIVSWFGEGLHRDTELSQLDMAIVERGTGRLRALVEIEETSKKPKTMLGDVFGTLFGEHITVQGRQFDVGEQTALIVMLMAPTQKEEDGKRMAYLKHKIEICQSALCTRSHSVGRLVIDTFTDGPDLEQKLQGHIGAVLNPDEPQ